MKVTGKRHAERASAERAFSSCLQPLVAFFFSLSAMRTVRQRLVALIPRRCESPLLQQPFVFGIIYMEFVNRINEILYYFETEIVKHITLMF